MSDRTPISLTPILITLDSLEYTEISGWPFPDSFVTRMLRSDIPQRVQFGNCRVWVYRDPECRSVGFGTLDICDDYGKYTAGQRHPYIPLLAVNPTIKSLGYGTGIVQHLIDEAALLACNPGWCHDVLYLDVSPTNEKAIRVYTEKGFTPVTKEPIQDSTEGGKPYIVMAKRVSIAPS
jgi:GNAT superfamily N-acetyltransferase